LTTDQKVSGLNPDRVTIGHRRYRLAIPFFCPFPSKSTLDKDFIKLFDTSGFIAIHSVQGTMAIEDVSVQEVPPDDPAVVALILKEIKRKQGVARTDGEHSFVKQQHRRLPR
jgi:hypothetical protein